MADLYLKSTTGSDANNGSTWALAKATLASALAAAAAGDTIYVSKVHAGTTVGAVVYTSPGTAANPVRIICVDDTGNPQPPTVVATTATESSTGSGNFSFNGYAYVYGVTFISGTSTNTCTINFSSTSPFWWRIEAGKLKLAGNNVGGTISIGASSVSVDDQLVELVNTTVEFANAAHGLIVRGPFRWSNTPSAVLGTAPTVLFKSTTGGIVIGNTEVRGVDLSALGANAIVDIGFATFADYLFQECKLGASSALVMGSVAGQGGQRVRFINCDNGDTNNHYYFQNYQGTITQDTTVVRTNGASDGSNSFSRKMASSANTKFYSPLKSDPIDFWNTTAGAPITVSVPVVTDNVTLTDADAWVEVQYMGTSGNPRATFTSDRAADVLATPANQTADGTSIWTTTGITTPVQQTLSVTITPQKVGPIHVRVVLAKPSTTMWFDPFVVANSSRQYMVGSDATIVNERAPGGVTGGMLLHSGMTGGLRG